MNFPRKEATAVLVWMREQMYGETITEWTNGNEHDSMAACADFLGSLVERESAEKRINTLFNKLVPVLGKADTVAGEIIRAVARISYRNHNDGDHIGIGYGNETCNPPARYLMARAGDKVKDAVEAMWGIYGDDDYDTALTALEEAVVDYLDQHLELRTEKNHEDMWDFRNQREDVEDYKEDWQ